MTIKGQTSLLLVTLLSLIAATALLIYQANVLCSLKQDCSNTERQISELKEEWEALAFERWMIVNLGTYPRNASPIGLIVGIEAFIFYSQDVSRENLASRFDPLAESFNITVAYLGLANQTNLGMLKDICNKTGFAEPSPLESYLILLSSKKIILLRLGQVDNEVFSKCVKYLSLEKLET